MRTAIVVSLTAVYIVCPTILDCNTNFGNNESRMEDFSKIKDMLIKFNVPRNIVDEVAIRFLKHKDKLTFKDLRWLAGHFFCESSWNPKAIGDRGKSFGLGQLQVARLLLIAAENDIKLYDMDLRKKLLTIDFNLKFSLLWFNTLKRKYGSIQNSIVVYNRRKLIPLNRSKHFCKVRKIFKRGA